MPKSSPSSTRFAPTSTRVAPSSTRVAPSSTYIAPSISTSMTQIIQSSSNEPTYYPMSIDRSGCGVSAMFPCQLYSPSAGTICPGNLISAKLLGPSSASATCLPLPVASPSTSCESNHRLVEINSSNGSNYRCLPVNQI